MNSENPTPPSGPSDPTPPTGPSDPINPTPPQNPADFTEYGSSILDDEDNTDKAKEPTPEEKEERQIFDNCRRLVSVIIDKTPVGTGSEYSGVFGSTIPARLDERETPNYLQHATQRQESEEDSRPDRPQSARYQYQVQGDPIFRKLDIAIHNASLNAYRPPDGTYKYVGDLSSITLGLLKRSDQLPSDSIMFNLLHDGQIHIFDIVHPESIDDGDHDNSPEFIPCTDHNQRMAKLNELYKIITDVYADLPRDNTTQSEESDNPNPSTPPAPGNPE